MTIKVSSISGPKVTYSVFWLPSTKPYGLCPECSQSPSFSPVPGHRCHLLLPHPTPTPYLEASLKHAIRSQISQVGVALKRCFGLYITM